MDFNNLKCEAFKKISNKIKDKIREIYNQYRINIPSLIKDKLIKI